MTNDAQRRARGGWRTPNNEWRTVSTFSIRHSPFVIHVAALVVAVGLGAAALQGQTPPAKPSAPPSPATGAQKPVEAPATGSGQPPATGSGQASSTGSGQAEPQGYTYNPEGRRDPFVSLLASGGAALRSVTGGVRPPGLAGLSASEVSLKGTLQSRTGYVALVQGADNKTYIVRAGDKLLDGTVRAVTENGMVILQQVNDPLSLQKEREVRKVLRQTDEVK